MTNAYKRSCTILILLGLAICAYSQIYVKATAAGGNNGSSWENAYTDLNVALQSASNGDQVWVAAGTYQPTNGSDRAISFEIPSGVQLLGGFPQFRQSRPWKSRPTS